MSADKPVAIITGASRGLGRALAREFAKQNYRLALLARNQAELSQLVDELTSTGCDVRSFSVDLSDTQTIAPLLDQIVSLFQRVDLLINNAGMGCYKPFMEHSADEIETMIALNLVAPMLLTQAVVPVMQRQGYGHIVNIGSDLARKPLANMTPYVASKHGLYGFSQSLLREVKSDGIRVSIINSGIIDSSFADNQEGTQDRKNALQPEHLAKLISQVVHQPEYQLIDEIMVHPLHQDF
jgi:short-subunit dehydrogenase